MLDESLAEAVLPTRSAVAAEGRSATSGAATPAVRYWPGSEDFNRRYYEGVLDLGTDALLLGFVNETEGTAPICDELCCIATALLNGFAPETPAKRTNRYGTLYTTVNHANGDIDSPSLFIVDFERDARLMLTLTCSADDAINFHAMRAAEAVAMGLNRIGYDWAPATPEEDECRVRRPVPAWALPVEWQAGLAGWA